MTVSSLAKGTRQSPHGKKICIRGINQQFPSFQYLTLLTAIAEIMKYQNKSFIAVAGKVAAIHEEIEKLKKLYTGSYGNKTIKLTGELHRVMIVILIILSDTDTLAISQQYRRFSQKSSFT